MRRNGGARQLVIPGARRSTGVLSREQTERLAAAMRELVRGEITRVQFEQIRIEVTTSRRVRA